MIQKIKLIGILMLSLLVITACVATSIEGSGNVVTETRDIDGPVTEISMSGIGTASVTVGEELSVTVETDDNVQEYVSTTVNDGILNLRIDTAPGAALNPTDGIEYTVTLPELNRLDIRGVTRASVSGVSSETLEVSVSGTATATVSGETDDLTVDVTGTGNFRGFDLTSTTATVNVSGATTAQVRVTDSLTADASGTSTVIYQGDPENVETETGGTGEVISAG
jgi:hypothetical protein